MKYKYDFHLIGKRIRNERKAAGYKSQADLIERLKKDGYSISRNTLSDIEQGKTNHYDSDLLFELCEIFNCEIGYLLCEYDCKTGRNTDIAIETGLNEAAINVLREINFYNRETNRTDILSLLILHPDFSYFLSMLGANASDGTKEIVCNKARVSVKNQAIINSDLKDTVIRIASDIRKQYKPNPYRVLYESAYGLYKKNRLTLEQLQDVINHYDKGDYEYIPADFKP